MFNNGNSHNNGGSGTERCNHVVNGLRAYWEAKRVGTELPLRANTDPRGIEHALEHSFILERVTTGNGRFRVAGACLNELMGMEVRGMPLTSLFVPEARRRISEAIEETFAAPAIVNATLRGESGYGRPALAARLLLLPLRSDFRDVTRALGCIVTDGQIGRVPRRFEVASLRTETLGTGKTASGFAEESTPFEHKTAATPAARRRMFRIVSND